MYYCRYDVEKNSTETDYTESEERRTTSTLDFIRHTAVVTDYLIMATDVSLISLLGITCVPALENNVEVSIKWLLCFLLMNRKTQCTSSNGIIKGSDYINSNTTFYINFRITMKLRLISSIQKSIAYKDNCNWYFSVL